MTEPSLPEESIFAQALELESAAERETFLDRACGDDRALRAAVEALLRADARTGDLLDLPEEPAATLDQPGTEQPCAVIGPYKLLQEIGEGGMGTVYMAEQEHPVRRRVALKLIKLGMDSRQVIARFQAERQALALMDHPNIAKVLEAGTTQTGRPYFVMELVKGVPITKYCDEHRLTPRERLELFIPVCQAVQHAHQKGIIHRDLKPSNVMVALYDGKPVPKVIDFGVAKATGPKLTEATLYTELGAFVGTPEYMSSEQAQLNQLDIDTRSDIFALGVLLYELLTGTTPLQRKRLKDVPLLEILRLVREEESPKPSTRLSTTEELTSIAANRSVEPRQLSGIVRGELDWIVMKCLERDRNRRYETANSFALDLQRYLVDEPVQACPPSAWYRFRKFARRHKRLAAMASFVSTLLVVAVTVLGVSYAQVQEALEREREQQSLYFQRIATVAGARANHQASRAEELLDLCPPKLRGWEWHYLKRLPFADVPVQRNLRGITRVALSRDGRTLASGNVDGVVTIWDARTGAERRELPKHGRFIRALAFSPDGQLLATGCEDDSGMVKIWNPGTRELVQDLSGHASALIALVFSPNGRFVATACQDDVVRLWDVASGQERRRWTEKSVARDGLGFSHDGGRLLTASMHGIVRVRDAASGEPLSTFRGKIPWAFAAAFSGDGRLVALGSEDGTVKVWETDTGKEIHTLQGHTSAVISLAFLAGDRRLASGSDDRTLKIWDLATGQEALQLGVFNRRVNCFAVSADGLRLFYGVEGTIRVADGRLQTGGGGDGQTLVLGGHAHTVVAVSFSRDGRRLASVSWDKTVKVWDADTGQEQRTLRGHEASFTDVVFSPDGRLIASASWDGTVSVWDAHTGQERFPPLRGNTDPVYGVAFRPNGRWLASAHHDGTVKVWDTATGVGVHHSIPAQIHPVLGVAFSPDGELLATAGGKAETVGVWKVATGDNRLLPLDRGGIVWRVAFSPDGRLLAAPVGSDGEVFLWDVPAGKAPAVEPRRTLSHGMRVFRLAFSRDSRCLATVSLDQAVRLWDVTTDQEPFVIRGHVGDLGCVAFSPADGRLATGAGFKGRGEIRVRNAALWEKKP